MTATTKKRVGRPRLYPETCTWPGCDRPHYMRGLCNLHRQRQDNGTDMDADPRHTAGEADQFIERLFSEALDECVIWPWGRSSTGYAVRATSTGTSILPRAVCERQNGSPPDPSYHASHTCDNGSGGCVNPLHLIWETPAENAARLRGKPKPQHRSHLTEEEVIAILDARAAGETAKVIATRLGVPMYRVFDVFSKTKFKPSFTRVNAMLAAKSSEI